MDSIKKLPGVLFSLFVATLVLIIFGKIILAIVGKPTIPNWLPEGDTTMYLVFAGFIIVAGYGWWNDGKGANFFTYAIGGLLFISAFAYLILGPEGFENARMQLRESLNNTISNSGSTRGTSYTIHPGDYERFENVSGHVTFNVAGNKQCLNIEPVKKHSWRWDDTGGIDVTLKGERSPLFNMTWEEGGRMYDIYFYSGRSATLIVFPVDASTGACK